MAEDCIFCKIAAGEIPATEVYSDGEFYAFRDIHPLAPTHVLVIPRQHLAKITDATAADAEMLGRMLLVANAVAEREGLTEQGFRCVVNCGPWGGQAVFHLHMHVLGGRKLSDSPA
jgi:histidine triad (HIT) family protein